MQFRNQSPHHVELQYLHSDHSEWSGKVPAAAGAEIMLAREYYFRDVRGLRIIDGGQRYSASASALNSFHRICDRSSFCTITYLGDGRVMVQRA